MSAPAPSGWTSGRRWSTWANVAVQSVLILALLAVVSLLARGHASRLDLTSRRSFTVGAGTEDLLRRFPYPLAIWASGDLYSTSQDRSLAAAVSRTLELLREFELRNPGKIKLRVVSGTGDAEFRRHWPGVQPATVYFLADLGSGRVNKKTVEVYQLYQGNSATGEIAHYRGELVLAQAIRELGAGTRRILYETEGHGEMSTSDPRQLGRFKDLLGVNEGVEFRKFPIATYKSVPPDCDLLCILGPAQPFADAEIGVLKDYLDRGGSLLVAVRPRVPSGLEGFLEGAGAKIGDNLVLDAAQSIGKISRLQIRDFNAHDINQGMAGLSLVVEDTCTVDPVEKGDPAWKITPLLMSGRQSWEETGPTGPGTRPKPDGKERTGDLKIVVAVEKPAPHPSDAHHKKAKIVVWGSTSFFLPPPLTSRYDDYQATYLINNFRWLADRAILEIPHDKVSVTPLDLSEAALVKLRWTVLLGFPALAAVLGVLAWFLRRS